MKKKLIALSVSTAAIAANVNATELYNQEGTSLEIGGRAEARLSALDGKVEDRSRIRLNFLGKVELTSDLYGIGFYEGEFTTNDLEKESSLDNRYTYAGLGGQFGEITYGKNDGALGMVTDFTDIMAYHGNSAADKIAVADRADNMIAYQGHFDTLSVKASYRFADRDTTNNGTLIDNGQEGYSIAASYVLSDTGLAFGAGYADQDQNNQHMLAAAYTMGDFYVAGSMTDGEKDYRSGKAYQDKYNRFNSVVDYSGYEIAAKYTLGKTAITSTYNYAETASDTSAQNIAIDTTYYFQPNLRGYVSYNVNLLDSGDQLGSGTVKQVESEDEIALGLRYDF